MRQWLFALYLVVFVIAVYLSPLTGLAIFPSVLLAYWIWKDGEQIEFLREQIRQLKHHTDFKA